MPAPDSLLRLQCRYHGVSEIMSISVIRHHNEKRTSIRGTEFRQTIWFPQRVPEYASQMSSLYRKRAPPRYQRDHIDTVGQTENSIYFRTSGRLIIIVPNKFENHFSHRYPLTLSAKPTLGYLLKNAKIERQLFQSATGLLKLT